MKVLIETHGCKLNMADSQTLAKELSATGFEIAGRGDTPDVFVLNSCTVTQTADSKARGAVASARRRYPGALIVMTGCYPERDAAEAGALAAVDIVVTNRRKPEVAQDVAEALGVAFTPCGDGDMPPLQSALLGRTRASVKVQEGCDQVCAYCIVPKVRGRERSIPVESLIAQVGGLTAAGCSEVILTGTQLGSYGFDLDSIGLTGMLRRLLNETAVPRIRVSSLQPLEITDGLLSLWSESRGRLCPHFHIPLQSGSDGVLRRMRRRYTGESFLQAVERVRSAVPGASVTTDIITGFPGETGADHAATLAVAGAARFADAHVFPYSERPGTSAAHFDDHLAPAIRAQRAAEVREITARDAAKFRERSVGQVRPALWERSRGSGGLTDNYLKVRFEGVPARRLRPVGEGHNLIEDVRLTGVRSDGSMIAEPV
jgi:threonylcarbamoyladenosine tRNA methylthiotransferase MtaB